GDVGVVTGHRLGGAAVDRVLDVLDAGVGERRAGQRVGRRQVDADRRAVPVGVGVVARARVAGVDLDGRRVVRRLGVAGVVGRPVLDRVDAVVGVIGRGRDGDVGVVTGHRLGGAAVDRVLDVLDAGVGERRAGQRVGRRQVDADRRAVPVGVGVVARAR